MNHRTQNIGDTQEQAMKFKVGDKVEIYGTVSSVDNTDLPYCIKLNDGKHIWFNRTQVMPATPSSANATQVGGTHYVTAKIQPWDFIIGNGLGFAEGNVVKYITRHNREGGEGVNDLRKARHYLDKLIEIEEGAGK